MGNGIKNLFRFSIIFHERFEDLLYDEYIYMTHTYRYGTYIAHLQALSTYHLNSFLFFCYFGFISYVMTELASQEGSPLHDCSFVTGFCSFVTGHFSSLHLVFW